MLLLSAVVVFGGTALAGTASAGQVEAPAGTAAATDPAGERAAQAYKQNYPAISAAQARAAVAGRPLYDAVSAHPAIFGGAWFDPPSGTVHIAVTARTAARTAAGLAARLGLRLRTHLVERNLAELEQLAERIRDGADDLALAAAGNVGIDVPTNRVLVSLPGNQLPAGAGPLALPPGVGIAD
jgi:streptogrisin C